MTMKQIKVSEGVKSLLDSIKLENESYNLAIQRLLIENERLSYDKDVLVKLLLKETKIEAPLTLEHKYVPFIELILFDYDIPDDEKLNSLKKYFSKAEDVDKELLLNCILITKESSSITSGVLIDFERWVNEEY